MAQIKHSTPTSETRLDLTEEQLPALPFEVGLIIMIQMLSLIKSLSMEEFHRQLRLG